MVEAMLRNMASLAKLPRIPQQNRAVTIRPCTADNMPHNMVEPARLRKVLKLVEPARLRKVLKLVEPARLRKVLKLKMATSWSGVRWTRTAVVNPATWLSPRATPNTETSFFCQLQLW